MMNSLQTWWQQRPTREQRLLKIGAPLILLLLVGLMLDLQGKGREYPVAATVRTQSGLERMEQQRLLVQHLAESSGLKVLQLQLQGDLLLLDAEAESARAVQQFLQQASVRELYWRHVQLQGIPVRLQIELVSLQ